VDHQQHHGVPHLQRVRDEEYPQPSRRRDEQAHAHWMMRRGSNRSASAPAATENIRNGSQCDSTASREGGEWNF